MQVQRGGVRMFKYQPDIKLAAPDPKYYIKIAGLMNITACTAWGPDGPSGRPSADSGFTATSAVAHVAAANATTTGALTRAHDGADAIPEAKGLLPEEHLANVLAAGAPQATGPPVYMSFPHYCYVDPKVAEMTVGTKCDHARHDLWLGVEPVTGITMAAAKRLQVRSRPPCKCAMASSSWP